MKLSVVMPVYNAQIYLEGALESIFAQSFQEFELICVDDASDDILTDRILKTFQRRHHNMQIVKLESRVGAAEARNIGFSKVQGKYTIFLDADDIFAPDLFESLYQCICQNDADVCLCGYEGFYIKKKRKYYVGRRLPDKFCISGKKQEQWLVNAGTVPWNKLCRTQFLREHNIYFQSLSSSNDVFFSCMVMVNANKICYVGGRPLIFHRAETKTQISANRNPVNLYRAVKLLKDTQRGIIDDELLVKWIGALLLQNGIWNLKKSRNEYNNKEFYELAKTFFKKHPIRFQNDRLETYRQKFLLMHYESNWFCDVELLFLEQLNSSSDKLMRQLAGNVPIYLWGLGSRGNAFQKFCRIFSINLQGVTDINDDRIGAITEYGNRIVCTEDVLSTYGLVIASNHEIYIALKAKNKEFRLLDLEEFCPEI